jgi:hypothetical protein
MRITVGKTFTILLFLGMLVLTSKTIADPDFWWHLSTGKYITENRLIPHADPEFSSTAGGKTWVTHEWFTEVIMWGLFKIGSFGALSLFFALLATISFALVFARSPGKPYIAGFATMLGVLVSWPIIGVRPQVFSLFFLSVYVFILERYSSRPRPAILIWLPLSMLCWVNLHGGFMLGLAVILAFLVGKSTELALRIFPDDENPPRYGVNELIYLAAAFVASVGVVVLNPNGFAMFKYPIATLNSPSMQRYLVEWLSPDFHELTWLPLAILILALLGLGMFGRKRFSLTSIGLVTASAYAALRSMRNVPLFGILATPILAGQVSSLVTLNPSTDEPPRRLRLILGPLLIVAVAVTIMMIGSTLNKQSKLNQQLYPTGAVEWILENHPSGNIYNSYHWGGYLIWRLFPEYPVFIDGRTDLYGDSFMDQYISSYFARSGWQEYLRKYGVRIVLVEPDSPLSQLLGESSDWGRVYSDDLSALFVKK